VSKALGDIQIRKFRDSVIVTENLPASYMKQAIEQMRMSEGRGPKVGAVIVTKDNNVIAGHKKDGTHAERAVIEEALNTKKDLRGATLYSTLEPCVSVESSTDLALS